MKPLSKYLKESYKDEKQGHYEDFVDEAVDIDALLESLND